VIRIGYKSLYDAFSEIPTDMWDAMEPSKPAKISFCTTCKNRFWQIAHTMPLNLAAIEADGSAEMTLVNYNSQDELDVWIRQFRSATDAGNLRYVHERSDPHFHMSKAKNLAHFAATGEFVVNLDADNFIGDTIARYRRVWQDNPDTVIHGFCGDRRDGTFGRIGMARHHFLALGGYDEGMLSGGVEDDDLLGRADASGLDYIRLAQPGIPAIRNSVADTIRHSESFALYRTVLRLNGARMDENIRIGQLVANCERTLRSVLVNFTTELEI
jgi:hypothetical protein